MVPIVERGNVFDGEFHFRQAFAPPSGEPVDSLDDEIVETLRAGPVDW